MGRAVARFAQATAERIEKLERRVDDHERATRRDIDALGARVAELESIERHRQRDTP